MRFAVLGPLSVTQGDRTLPLCGIHCRATLGFLLFNANRVVPTSQLIRALWGIRPPTTARKMIHNAVANLRKDLFPDPDAPDRPALLTAAPGYLLRLDPAHLDLLRFHDLAAKGRAELAVKSWDRAAAFLRKALALWRGPALADLVEDGIDWPELTAIENTRLNVLEDCMDAELATGRHHQIVNELQMTVDAEPLRERSCRQLMIALYRCGRQAEALHVYRRIRSILVNEFGIDPSPDLREMEYAILNQDPMLLVPAK